MNGGVGATVAGIAGYNKCAGRILRVEFQKMACLYHENAEYIHPFIH